MASSASTSSGISTFMWCLILTVLLMAPRTTGRRLLGPSFASPFLVDFLGLPPRHGASRVDAPECGLDVLSVSRGSYLSIEHLHQGQPPACFLDLGHGRVDRAEHLGHDPLLESEAALPAVFRATFLAHQGPAGHGLELDLRGDAGVPTATVVLADGKAHWASLARFFSRLRAVLPGLPIPRRCLGLSLSSWRCSRTWACST